MIHLSQSHMLLRLLIGLLASSYVIVLFRMQDGVADISNFDSYPAVLAFSKSKPSLVNETIYPQPRGLLLDPLWESSTRLPPWMKEYFQWHREQRAKLRHDNWNEFQFIVMSCLKIDDHCGGTADRLRPLPFLVRVAAQYKRILLIHWDKPASLESFLLPPIGGIDWRLPEFLRKPLLNAGTPTSAVSKFLYRVKQPTASIVRARIQAHDHGSTYYNEQGQAIGEPQDAYRQHFHDIWYTFFTPHPNIAKRIEDEMERMKLTPGYFAFAHVRANYAVEQKGREPELVENWTKTALNCLSNIRPGGPYFLSSDSLAAKRIGMEYGKARNTRVEAQLDDTPPLHLDLAPNWESRDASEFYSTFVDLYLMSMGHCMSFNVGGFAKFGLLLSGRNFTCSKQYWTKGVAKAHASKSGCPWTPPELPMTEEFPYALERPLFLPPMPK